MVRIRDGEAEAINVKPRMDKDDVGARARSFVKMINKFRKMVRFSLNPGTLLTAFPMIFSCPTSISLSMLDRKAACLFRGSIAITQISLLKNSSVCFDFSPSLGLTKGALGSTASHLSVPDWRGEGSVWESYRRICPPESAARRIMGSRRAIGFNGTINYFHPSDSFPGPDFAFARETARKFSFCDSPAPHVLQGHFFSDWRTIPVLYPILSPAKGSGFSDIKIPSHYYYGTTRRYTYGWDEVNLEIKRLDCMETPWEKKDDKIFFRGATTGGGSAPRGFSPHYQRHR